MLDGAGHPQAQQDAGRHGYARSPHLLPRLEPTRQPGGACRRASRPGRGPVAREREILFDPIPRPATTSTSASTRASASRVRSTPRSTTRGRTAASRRTLPPRPRGLRHSAAWGNTGANRGHLRAMRRARDGRHEVAAERRTVCSRRPVFRSMSSEVQSAVKPVCRRTATPGASSRPKPWRRRGWPRVCADAPTRRPIPHAPRRRMRRSARRDSARPRRRPRR